MQDGRRRGALLGRLGLEVVSIVFAVTLALALDGWRKGVETDRLVDSVLASIAEEVSSNAGNVESSLDYHRRAVERMGAFAGEDQPGGVSEMLSTALPEGLRPAFLRGSAWNTAVASGVVPELPYDVVRIFSSAYTLQQRYDAMARDLMQAVYQSMLSSDLLERGTPSGVAAALAPVLNDFVAIEGELQQIYRVIHQLLPADGGS